MIYGSFISFKCTPVTQKGAQDGLCDFRCPRCRRSMSRDDPLIPEEERVRVLREWDEEDDEDDDDTGACR